MKTNYKTPIQIVVLSLVVLAGYQNCAPGVLDSKSLSSEGSNDGGSTFGECADGLCEVFDSQVVGVSNSQNMLSSMTHQAGLPAASVSNTTRTTFATQSSKVSETGKANSITAPMWVAITTVSSEVCNDLYNQERVLPAADRRMYASIDFTKGYAEFSSQAKDDVIRRFARSFWARNESGQEKILIRNGLEEAFQGKTAVADTQAAALFLCSAMLSSLRAHTY